MIFFLFCRRKIGHFTQVVRDIAYDVGCALAKYKIKGYFFSYFVCNYAVTNMQDDPIYDAGETASACTSGTNPKYPGLCSENETYTSSRYFN